MNPDWTRYQRQLQLPRFGARAQQRLASARVLVAGCGALGTVVCEQLARAGIGTITIVDRDLVELSNLQRQTLFTEQDARRAVPKAEAAKARLTAVNATVAVRAFVDDLHAGNARRYAEACDLIVDCLDNFETRYLLNDCAVDLRIPLVYGGAVGMQGMAAALLPHGDRFDHGAIRWSGARSTPCLRCLAPEPPAPGEVATCDTAGILGPVAGVVASIEAGLALRLIAEDADDVPAELVRVDFARLAFSNASIAGARDAACVCCASRRFDFLAQQGGDKPWRVLCGRNAVEIRLGAAAADASAFARIESQLRAAGSVASSVHGDTRVLRAELAGGGAISVLAGAGASILAIVDGTSDPEQARSIVARCIGV